MGEKGPDWRVKIQRVAILASGCGLARFIYLIGLFYLGELTEAGLLHHLGQLVWVLYLCATGLVFWSFVNIDEQAFDRMVMPMTRLQLVILATILWPVLIPIGIILYLRGDE